MLKTKKNYCSRMRVTYVTVQVGITYIEDDFALHYVLIYLGVNSRAELVTVASCLRPERRFAVARENSFYLT